MPSPFPGMDPYLELPAYWPDTRFINCWCDAIADALPTVYQRGRFARRIDYQKESLPDALPEAAREWTREFLQHPSLRSHFS